MATGGLMQKLQQLTKIIIESKGFVQYHNKLSLVSATKGQVIYSMEVSEEHLNLGKTMHGGLTATIVDHVSTMAIIAADNPPGVSVDMNISYMEAAREGDVLTIKSECLKAGKNLGFATVDILNQKGRLVAQGKHTKYFPVK